MSTFVHEDGQGNFFDDNGQEVVVVEMEVDEEMFPLENVEERLSEEAAPEAPAMTEKRVVCPTGGLSASAAGANLGVPAHTAQGWVKKDQTGPQDFIMKQPQKKFEGRPATLHDEHKGFLVDLIDEESALVLDQVMDQLTSQFMDLSLSKTALYNFVT
ncbi:hypothetical protein DFQ30_009826 [Apophysomyces sp. BC1015]|nr:hypothetical protein DFQ30_009826 [Apophysomyces sp. BC1015]